MNLSLIIAGLLTAVTVPELLQNRIENGKVSIMRISCISIGCTMLVAGLLLGL